MSSREWPTAASCARRRPARPDHSRESLNKHEASTAYLVTRSSTVGSPNLARERRMVTTRSRAGGTRSPARSRAASRPPAAAAGKQAAAPPAPAPARDARELTETATRLANDVGRLHASRAARLEDELARARADAAARRGDERALRALSVAELAALRDELEFGLERVRSHAVARSRKRGASDAD